MWWELIGTAVAALAAGMAARRARLNPIDTEPVKPAAPAGTPAPAATPAAPRPPLLDLAERIAVERVRLAAGGVELPPALRAVTGRLLREAADAIDPPAPRPAKAEPTHPLLA